MLVVKGLKRESNQHIRLNDSTYTAALITTNGEKAGVALKSDSDIYPDQTCLQRPWDWLFFLPHQTPPSLVNVLEGDSSALNLFTIELCACGGGCLSVGGMCTIPTKIAYV